MRKANAIGSSSEAKPAVMQISSTASSKPVRNVTTAPKYPGSTPCMLHGQAAPQPIAGATTAAIDRRPTHIRNAVGLRKCCSREAAEAKIGRSEHITPICPFPLHDAYQIKHTPSGKTPSSRKGGFPEATQAGNTPRASTRLHGLSRRPFPPKTNGHEPHNPRATRGHHCLFSCHPRRRAPHYFDINGRCTNTFVSTVSPITNTSVSLLGR